MVQQQCTPFSPDWPGCLNNKTQSQVHSILADAIIAGAMNALQQQSFKDELIAHNDTDAQAKLHIGSMPTIGE